MATGENTKESAEVTLKTKLVQLGRAKDKSDNALKTGKEHVIRRHIEDLKESLKEVSKWHRAVEAEKITSKEESREIDKWSDEVESQMEEADQKIGILEQWLSDTEVKGEDQQRKERMDFELKLEEAKIKLKAEFTKVEAPMSEISEKSASGSIEARLPKLTITKFNGTYADWPRFWGQYSETIDKSVVPPVTKFSYLRELLCEKAKKAIEALPYTAEGYNRAVSILKDRFGNDSEVVKAYVKEILDLPYTPSTSPKKIHEFYERLAYSVQSLETLKKLEAVNGTVSMTLEKLPNIRGDLVRSDPEWERWTFVQFTEALRLWTRRNPVEAKIEDPNKRDRRSQYQFRTHQGKPKVVCIATKKVIDHPNAVQSRPWTKGRSFWQQRNFVSTAQVLPIGHPSVEVLQRASIVTKGIIPQFVMHQKSPSQKW
jgi:Arc/MetJ-type ribon-helix-helix transcriptional regulator